MVCTANIVRSPMAEAIARDLARSAAFPVEVSSAGVYARPGSPIDPQAGAALLRLGLDGSAHRSRLLAPELIAAADLILTMENGHASAAVNMDPAAAHKTFTLPEFADLVAGGNGSGSPERARALVRLSAGRRRVTTTTEVADPYMGPDARYDACVRVLSDALGRSFGALL